MMPFITFRKASAYRLQGFSYVGLMLLIALISIAASATLSVGALVQRKQAEDELLYIGHVYRKALRSYYEATPPGKRSDPARLEYLVKDNRFTPPKHHLRQLYFDPMTNSQQWGLLTGRGGGIVGVFSLSDQKPIKLANFDEADKDFVNAKTYSDWLFVFGDVCSQPGCSKTRKSSEEDTP